MYYNFESFVNEQRDNKKLEKLKSKRDKLISKIENISNDRRKKKKQDELKELETQISELEKYTSRKEEKKEVKKETPKEEKEETPVKKLNRKSLQKKLNQWNSIYSNKINFLNDMPKSVPDKANLAVLLKYIADDKDIDYRKYVSEGLTKLSKYLENDIFKGVILDVVGYTSTPGTDSYNRDLSIRRAEIISKVLYSLMDEKTVEFNIIGMGEDKDSLIIKNDDSIGDLQIKSGVKIDPIILDKIKSSKDERQKLNRRVKITLPEFKDVEPDIRASNAEKKEVSEKIEKPVFPDPESVEYNYDSYILTKKGEDILKDFALSIDNFNKKSEDKITDIYISAHTKRADGNSEYMQKLQDESLFILSANRGIIAGRFIKQFNKDINIHIYPVAFEMVKEKKIEIRYERTKSIEEADDKSETLCNQYDVEFDDGVKTDDIIHNKALRDIIIRSLKIYAKGYEVKEKIPVELWYTKGRFGMGHEKNLDKFKNNCKKTLKNAHASRDPYDYVRKIK